MIKTYDTCTWLDPLIKRAKRHKVIETTLEHLEPHKADFSAVACTGYSSSLISGIIAHSMGKDLIVVRKETDSRHSHLIVEGPTNSDYIFIDDLIASGQTWLRVRELVKEKLKSRMVGIYLYYDFNLRPAIFNKDHFLKSYGIPILNPERPDSVST